MTGLCAPWSTELAACDQDEVEDGQAARALQVASELLYAASGRMFPGVCTDRVRPCQNAGCLPWAYPGGAGRLLRDASVCCHSSGNGPVGLWCGSSFHAAVPLPNTPVVDITEVVIDGQPLTPDAWRVVDDRWLLRSSGQWPTCGDLTSPDGFTVTYRYGSPPPESGRLAAELLACELLSGWNGNSNCRLPKRLTQITSYQGATESAALDTFDQVLRQGMGIPEVAAFIQTFNPGHVQAPARLVAPHVAARQQVRRVR